MPDRLIGTPERASARQALQAHLAEKRLDPAEYERRLEATSLARTQSELLRVFADLPLPHPQLPPETAPPVAAPDDEPPAVFFAGCLTLGLGLPVAVVLGFAYGIWWSLAVPVVVTVAMAYIEHLRTPRPPQRNEPQGDEPRGPQGDEA